MREPAYLWVPVIGSDLKVDGGTWNPVDPERAERFMAEVRQAR